MTMGASSASPEKQKRVYACGSLVRSSAHPHLRVYLGSGPVANGFAPSLHLHMKTRKSRGLPLTYSKNEVRSWQILGRATGRAESEAVLQSTTAASAAMQTASASAVLNIQWRHVLNSACRLATENHMFPREAWFCIQSRLRSAWSVRCLPAVHRRLHLHLSYYYPTFIYKCSRKGIGILITGIWCLRHFAWIKQLVDQAPLTSDSSDFLNIKRKSIKRWLLRNFFF